MKYIPRMSAADANKTGLLCKHGHAGQWLAFTRRSGPWAGQEFKQCILCRKAGHAKFVYGLSYDDYEKLRARQQGRCAICWTDQAKLTIDHNHTTGKVRALLCQSCNTTVGIVESGFVQLAINYLKQYEDADGVDSSI